MRLFLFVVAVIATALTQLPSEPALAADAEVTNSASETLDGVIKPFEVIEVGSPMAGLLAEVFADSGDSVVAGTLLARLENSVERESAELARLNAAGTASLMTAQVKVESAHLKLEKREQLSIDGIVTSEELEAARTEALLAELELASVKETAAIFQVEFQKAEALVARTEILAPADSVVLSRNASPGEIVTSSPEASIFTLARLDPLRVEARAPVAWLAKLRLGETALVVPTFDETLLLEAKLTVIDAVADAASETVRIELELPNPDLSLPAGIRCRITLAH